MPYKSTADLPAAVRKLPAKAQSIYMAAFNASFDEHGEESAHAIAWSAVKKKYEKEGDVWVAKKTADGVHDRRVQVCFVDRLELADADLRETSNGYLVAQPRIARTGIQTYRGREVGRPDLDSVRVFRPESEVFHPKTLASYAHCPVTNDHPSSHVDASNWKQFAVGQAGDEVVRDGHFIRVPMVVMDGGAVGDVRGGKKELSAGYSSELNWRSGKTADGELYDAVQTTIRANHIAIVDVARGGPMLCIGDSFAEFSQPDGRKTTMPQKTIMVDGLSVMLEDRDAELVVRHITKLTDDNKKLATQIATTDTAIEAAKKAGETKDGEIAALKKQLADAVLSPQKIDQLVRDRMGVVSSAVKVLGDKFTFDGKTDVEIRRAVVVAKLGDAIAKAMSDEAVAGAFGALTATAGNGGTDNTRPLADAFSAPSGIHSAGDSATAAYQERNKHLNDAWRQPAKQ